MADLWIKMRVCLHEHPKVVRMAYASDAYGRTHVVRIATVVGLLHRTWSIADSVSADGVLPGYTAAALDAMMQVEGWTDQLVEVGWARVTPDGIELCGYTEHNGATAKRRAQEADRQRAIRKSVRKPSAEPYAPDADAVRVPSSSSSSSPSLSPSPSLSESEGEPEREAAPRDPGSRRAKHSACTLEAQLDEFEFGTLRSDVVEAARAWSEYRRTRKPRAPAWGPSQWRPALRDAIRDPGAFIAAVQYSIRQKYQGLIEAKKPGQANGPRRPQSAQELAALADEVTRRNPSLWGEQP